MNGHLDDIYEQRFPPEVAARRRAMWAEIVRYLQRFVRPGPILDLACGEGYFISHVVAVERWASHARNTAASLPHDVRFVQADGLKLGDVLQGDHFGSIFMSNYLEHLPTRHAVLDQLEVARDLLGP